MRKLLSHFIAVILALTPVAGASGSFDRTQSPAPAPAPAPAQARAGDVSTFSVLLQGARIGAETVTLSRTASEWIISSFGRQGPPVNLVTTKFEMVYASDWQPKQLTINGTLSGVTLSLSTSFGLTTAISDLVQGDKKGSVTHVVSARTIVLPSNFYGSYEALAARLASAVAGAKLPIYVAPQAELGATVDRVTPRRIFTGSTAAEFRQYDLTFNNTAGPLAVEVWIDSRNRLARVMIPAASLMVLRDDLTSVMSRDEAVRRSGDEQVFIPAQGFNLAATVTVPQSAPPAAGTQSPKTPQKTKRPAVVLVPASTAPDRELISSGVAIFGQLAGALSDAANVAVIRTTGAVPAKAEAARKPPR